MTRNISSQEIGLIRKILEDVGLALPLPPTGTQIRPLPDGDMGSFSFDLGDTRSYSSTVGHLTFLDSDGKRVLATLHLDGAGDLYELDLLKSDFSPVETIPSSFD